MDIQRAKYLLRKSKEKMQNPVILYKGTDSRVRAIQAYTLGNESLHLHYVHPGYI